MPMEDGSIDEEIYIVTRTRKDGLIVNEKAVRVIVRFSFIRTYLILMLHKVFFLLFAPSDSLLCCLLIYGFFTVCCFMFSGLYLFDLLIS
jgi:hypothetical protein